MKSTNRPTRRAVVELAGDETRQFPLQQVNYNGAARLAEIVTPYGVHANLPAGSLVTVFPINNATDYVVALGGMPDQRVIVEQGEVVFFHPITKSKIHFKNDGSIEIIAPISNHTGDINLVGNLAVTGNITVTGNVDVVGNITATQTVTGTVDVVGGGISLKGHTHGGVLSGGAITEPPS